MKSRQNHRVIKKSPEARLKSNHFRLPALLISHSACSAFSEQEAETLNSAMADANLQPVLKL